MSIAILHLTKGGALLAERLASAFPNSRVIHDEAPIAEAVKAVWGQYDGIVFIMAAGIVVRTIAPLLADKKTDPAVVVADEKGQFAVSLLSGHLGGANELARRVAGITGGTAVITTASDTLGLTALDLWAKANGLVPEPPEILTAASAILVNNGVIRVHAPGFETCSLPPDILAVDNPDDADIVISNRIDLPPGTLAFRPRNLVVGVGCNRGVPAADIELAIRETLANYMFSMHSVRNLATIDIKRDEAGIIECASRYGWDIHFFGPDRLNSVSGISPSPAAKRATGAAAVAEPAALLSAVADKILVGKTKWKKDVTIAIAEARFTL
ncbi:MAG: cobalamin biosynthesis protein [Nitrospirae bacterium]|nr:cobalamin biosynthesis protein [Nitrospirota bacterium]